MSKNFDLSTGQLEATDRHDIKDAVYLLSGSVPGRGAIPDQVFYWATRAITAPLGAAGADVDFEPYIFPPQEVSRSIGFEPGEQASTPAVNISVRNLPFGYSESVVAAFTDDNYALESATATLRVVYIRPGQVDTDLVAADFSPLCLEGFFGAPQDVRLDGLVLPLYNRGAKRSMVLKWPQMPSDVPWVDSGSAFQADPIDADSLGVYPPIMFGRPDGWFKPIVHGCPLRGLSISGYAQGTTTIQFESSTRGGRRNVELASGQWYAAHFRWPQYKILSGTVDTETNIVTLYLASGLAAEIPRGAYIEHASTTGTWWVLAPHSNYGASTGSWPGTPTPPNPLFGWRLKNGEIKPDASIFNDRDVAITTLWDGVNRAPRAQCKVIGDGEIADSSTSATRWQFLKLERGAGYPGSGFIPIAYYDPDSLVDVTTQAEYSQRYSLTVSNRATGGNDGTSSGPNSSARDGNLTTACVAAAGQYFELDFPDAPAPFTNGDTVASTLEVHCIGKWNFETEAGSFTYGSTPVRSEAQTYTFSQANPVNMGLTLRCEADAGGSGGSVLDVVWHHALETASGTTRTQDAAVGTGYTVGEIMIPADLVMQFPVAAKQGAIPLGMGLAGCEVSGSLSAPTMRYNDATASGQQRYPVQRGLSTDGVFVDFIRPTQVMIGLHALLGKEGHTHYINLSSYDAAHQRFVDEDIRVNMALAYEPSWHELERRIGEQFRSVWYYGPSGHEVQFIESEATLEASGVSVRQSFRLPGCPAANCFESSGPLMERTPVSSLINTVAGDYQPDYLTETLTRYQEQADSTAVARNGTLRRPEGNLDMSFHSHVPHATSGSVPWTVSAQVSGILALYAGRQAYARTRFTFETAWIAHGVERGSIVRVSYPVSFNPPSYRNNICEVEAISFSPLNGGRYTVTARSVNKPQRGLDPSTTWVEVFTAAADAWTTRILNEPDVWADYWAQP